MSKKLRVGVLGCGQFAQSFVDLFMKHPYVESVVVADTDPVQAKETGEKFGVPYFDSLDALLEEDINKGIGNDWFRTKKQTSVRAKKGYKDSSYGIACSLVNYYRDLWTKEDIDDATKKAARRITDFIFS